MPVNILGPAYPASDPCQLQKGQQKKRPGPGEGVFSETREPQPGHLLKGLFS